MWPFKEKKVIKSTKKYVDYLPVGTIVKIYNSNEEYMIYRYLGNACMSFKNSCSFLKNSNVYKKTEENKNTYYNMDYALVQYPHAIMDTEIYIKHEDIELVLFIGYDDELRKSILNDLDNWNEEGNN